MKKLSDYELNELITLAAILKDEIHRFGHVSDKLPLGVTKPIDKYYEDLCEEQRRREEKF